MSFTGWKKDSLKRASGRSYCRPETRCASYFKLSLLCGTAFFVLICLLFNQAGAETSAATNVIKRFNAALLESMKKADQLGYSGRYNLLEPVIKDSFALPFMADQSVGRYGRRMKEEDRRQLLKTYTEWTIATYAARFDGYSGEKFETVSESRPERGTVTVLSKIIEPKRDSVDFYYKLRKMDNRWLIVDIQMAGVSQLALTRSQFVSVIKDKGFDNLIAMLKSKIDAFSKGREQ
jgi:phospholipid transport system substrate-binding protein